MFDTTTRKQTQITQVRHEDSYKQLELEVNRTSLYEEIVTDITIRNRLATRTPPKKRGVNSGTRAQGPSDLVQHVLFVLVLFTS